MITKFTEISKLRGEGKWETESNGSVLGFSSFIIRSQ